MSSSPTDGQVPDEQPSSGGGKTFTGYRRNRKTHWSIAFKDRLAQVLITAGGIGTIVAVTLMCVFLVWVVVPLFQEPQHQQVAEVNRGWLADKGTPVHMALDEYNLMGWAVFASGEVVKFRIDTGEILDEQVLVDEGQTLTAWSFPQRGDMAILGYADGTVRRATIRFDLSFMQLEDAPEHLRDLEPGEIATHGKQLAQMTPERQIRLVGLDLTLHGVVQTGIEAPVLRLDHSPEGANPSYVAVYEDGRAQYHRYRLNRMTGELSDRTTRADFSLASPQRGVPDYVKLTGLGDNIFAIWRDGVLERYDSRNMTDIRLLETVDIAPENAEVTTVAQLIGKTTLLVGDSNGDVRSFFRVAPEVPEAFVRQSLAPLLAQGSVSERVETVLKSLSDYDTFFRNQAEPASGLDNLSLVHVGTFTGQGAGPVTSIASSQRKRMMVVGHGDGTIRMHNATNERHLKELTTDHTDSIDRVVMNPRDEGLAAVSGTRVQGWRIDTPHPETSFRALFGKVWYEGYSYPTYTWQSTGGTDDFESKFSLVPLIFGTIKATFFAMLFAVPIALMAAIYTSEFLKPKLKAKIKPTIEMMASLPSVVLGFLAGLVVAQFVEDVVVAMLMAFITVPFTFLLFSQIFQTLSATARMRLMHWRFVILIVSLPVGIWLAGVTGPMVERALFWVEYPQEAVVAADGTVTAKVEYSIRAWLSAHRQDFPPGGELPKFHSSAIGGWMILFTPLSALAALFLMARYANPWLAQLGDRMSWTQLAFADTAKFILGCILAVLVAFIMSAIFSIFWDARGSFVDQYVQRNALIVGMMMGFAVIPIIYTIADDAMSAVPESLRSASLGAGATPWQTAVRVIIPTAMSGLFSACMIGFGRAVGETMIVLMAAGNTPIMEWNIFNGFRTLSANIAVEMMEAVKDSSNYRILFLAGLVLFIMTFIINTIAEMVRLHYRKKALEL